MSIRDWFKREADKSDPFDPLDQLKAKEAVIDAYLVEKLIKHTERLINDSQEEGKMLRMALDRMEARLDVMDTRINMMLTKDTDAQELKKIFIEFLDGCGFQRYKGKQHVENGNYPHAP